MMIEIAWSWLRYQPTSELSKWFLRRFAQRTARQRRVGIVALARRLLIDLWRLVELGVVPDGARLKTV
jgi:transposase